MPARLAILVMLATFGCAQSVGDIDRVQPNATRKTDLLGSQWYFRNTVTWAPATTGFTFTGETGNLEKLVWEIQEKSLVGYRAYPYIPGSDPQVEPTSRPAGTTATVCDAEGACKGGQPYFGAPVVAYPIVSHFDIQRSYSSATGEQGNVIEENARDRPWHLREFMRVDWSANLLNQGTELTWNTIQNPAAATSYNAWIQPDEPGTDPYDWPHVERDDEDRLTYLDFTGRYYVAPRKVFIEGYGEIPECWLLSSYRYDCTAQEIRIRTSIARVDPKTVNGYQPLVYGNDLMRKFGYFRTERLNYDRKFGHTESARILLANRFRMFERDFETLEDGTPDPTRPLPMAQRTPKPIVFYLSPASRTGAEAYQLYREAARTLEASWDKAFRRAVAQAQGKPIDQVPQMLHVCENPVPAVDSLTGAPPPAACGAPGFEARFGDLRYSFLNTISEPTPNGLLGYGPLSADPETGEIISGNANTYAGAVDTSAQAGLDVIDALSGEATIDDLIRGDDVKRYVDANPVYAQIHARTEGRIRSELQSVEATGQESRGALQRPTATLGHVLDGLAARGGPPSYGSDRMRAAAELLAQHPQLEAALLDNPEVQADLAGLFPPQLAERAGRSPDARREAARSVLIRPSDTRALERRRVEWASRRNIYLAEFMDRSMFALAQREAKRRAERVTALTAAGDPRCQNKSACTAAEARTLADNELRARLRQAVWRATSEHEIGHTFGLRHNFQGSFDALNYLDRYWELRASTLTVDQGGVAKLPRTPADLKAASDGTAGQLAEGMHEHGYSSIMDYGAKLTSDIQGIGKYDEAAILFAYSGDKEPGFVEVFEAARASAVSLPGSDGASVTVTGAAHDLPLVNASLRHPGTPNYTERYHYALAPAHFGEGADVSAALADGLAKLKRRRLMRWSEVKAAHERVAALLESSGSVSPQDVAGVPLEVPYMFCTDDHVGAVLSCNRFDTGADYYEIARAQIADYWNYYFFNHFKRDRFYFTSSGALNGTFGTFYELGAIYRHWVLALYGQTRGGQQALPRYPLDASLQDTWTMAVLDGVNAQLAVFSVPPSGFYMLRKLQGGGQRWDVLSEGIDFDDLNDAGKKILTDYYGNPQQVEPGIAFATVPRGQARRMYSRYDYKSGYDFFNRLVEVGHYNDQLGAMFAATEPGVDLLGADTTADRLRYSIPYYLVFKDELGETFGALWSSDEPKVRPTLYLEGGAPKLAFRTPALGQKYIQGFNYPANTPPPPELSPAPANLQLTWTARIYSLFLGMAMFSVNYDLDFAKASQVFKLGGQETVEAAPGYHVLEAADITTGARYAALERDGAPIDSTPAVRMVNRARGYSLIAQDPLMCPLPPGVEDRCLTPAEAADPAVVAGRRTLYTQLLQDTVRDLDIMRGFYGVYGRIF